MLLLYTITAVRIAVFVATLYVLWFKVKLFKGWGRDTIWFPLALGSVLTAMAAVGAVDWFVSLLFECIRPSCMK